MPPEDFLSWVVKTVLGAAVAVVMYFTKQLTDEVKQLKQDGSESKVSLANFKAEVAKDYARDVNVQMSLNRIHQRLDSLPKDIADQIRDTKR